MLFTGSRAVVLVALLQHAFCRSSETDELYCPHTYCLRQKSKEECSSSPITRKVDLWECVRKDLLPDLNISLRPVVWTKRQGRDAKLHIARSGGHSRLCPGESIEDGFKPATKKRAFNPKWALTIIVGISVFFLIRFVQRNNTVPSGGVRFFSLRPDYEETIAAHLGASGLSSGLTNFPRRQPKTMSDAGTCTSTDDVAHLSAVQTPPPVERAVGSVVDAGTNTNFE